MPVLYGVFLYMGVASLSGIQFWDRMKLYMMPSKHQPDFAYLRHVPLRRVHLFTLVQVICLAVLWTLKSTFLAIIFPIMILGLMVVRKLLDMVFSQHDLAWIDDVLPVKEKKKKKKSKDEDKKKKGKEKRKDKKKTDDLDDEDKYHAYSNCSASSESDVDRSITLHLKISCPSSPAVPGRGLPPCPVPHVKIEMESDYETESESDHVVHRRDISGETTL
ncbi:unnamed protein product [Arctogadus glacialis]